MKIRTAFTAAALALTLTTASCFGPNKAFNGLSDWNQEVVEQDWAKELIFLGLNIIPAYGVAIFVDFVVLNTIEYWGNQN
jgi:hypothetical protein